MARNQFWFHDIKSINGRIWHDNPAARLTNLLGNQAAIDSIPSKPELASADLELDVAQHHLCAIAELEVLGREHDHGEPKTARTL